MFKFDLDITKEYIESKISQEEIFEKFTGSPVVMKKKIRSPLRNDRNPTCSYIFRNNKLLLRDFSGHFFGDCYQFVMAKESCDFKTALERIAIEFNLKPGSKRKKKHTILLEEKTKADIKVTWKRFTKEDIKYWSDFGISVELLKKFNVGAVQNVFLNGELVYTYSKEDPCYAYWFNPEEIKVYWPKRKNQRFLCNTQILQGYSHLPKTGDLLIVTKSYKDVIFLSSLGYNAVAPQGESVILSQEEYDDLHKRFSDILVVYDFDLAGVKGANKMKRKYGTRYRFITNGRFGTVNYGAKDFTDLFFNTRCSLQVSRFIAY